MTVTIRDIIHARQRIRPYLAPTPLEAATGLGPGVHLKLEHVNPTHSFKVRGAFNAMLSLSETDRQRGIVTASSGNHAQAVAYGASLFGLSAKIVMPTHTPHRKVDGTRRYGAEVVLHGDFYDYAEQHARELEQTEGRTFISPYNDPRVIAGAGTSGLEIIEQLPEVERVIVPVGGGGLIAGIALAVRAINPACEIIGVNAESAPAMYNALHDDALPQDADTLAEALSGEIEGDLTISLCRATVDRVLLVSEGEISAAMRWLADKQGWIIEGGAACSAAALLSGKIRADGRPTVAVLTGGNIDAATLRRVLQT